MVTTSRRRSKQPRNGSGTWVALGPVVSPVSCWARVVLARTVSRAPSLDTLYVPIGLGSGICGAIAVRDALGLRTNIVGVVAAAAPAYARSLERGRLSSHEVTTRIADGMACRTPVPEALDLMTAGIERVVEVTDDEIEAAMRVLFADTTTS